MSQSPPILVERSEGVLHLRFNRPSSLNAIDSALAQAFLQQVEALADMPDVSVLRISGEGRAFMAGGDIAQFQRDPQSIPGELIGPMNQALALLAKSPVISIAQLHGPVAGAGMSLALACDLAVAADNTRFTFAYTQLGASGDLGISWSLPRLVGLRQALAMALLDDSLDANAALQHQLVNRVVPVDQLSDCTTQLISKLLALPALARGQIKLLMRQGLMRDWESQLAAERDSFSRCIEHEDFQQAVEQFLARRR